VNSLFRVVPMDVNRAHEDGGILRNLLQDPGTGPITHVCPNGAKGWSDTEVRLNSCRRCGGPLR